MTEYFDVVDSHDHVVGRATRDECHAKGLWHRGIHIVVVNSRNEILLQKRSMTKDLYKGYWTDAASGHVDSGEIYEQSAQRELREELGVSAPLASLFDIKKRAGNDNELIRVFLARHDGPFTPDKDEIDRVQFFELGQITGMLKTEHFTPATIEILEKIAADHRLQKKLFS